MKALTAKVGLIALSFQMKQYCLKPGLPTLGWGDNEHVGFPNLVLKALEQQSVTHGRGGILFRIFFVAHSDVLHFPDLEDQQSYVDYDDLAGCFPVTKVLVERDEQVLDLDICNYNSR